MMHKLIYVCLITLFLADGLAFSQSKYKKYKPQKAAEKLLSITVKDNKFVFIYFSDSVEKKQIFKNADIYQTNKAISIKDKPFIIREGIIFDNDTIATDNISKVEIQTSEDSLQINFLARPDKARINGKNRNQISLLENIDIRPGQFIRGSAVAFWGDILINGELNEDAIALYGDITVGTEAVIRGNILALNGEVDVTPGATVYGEIQSAGLRKKFSLRKRNRRESKDIYFSAYGKFNYNRVDGATPFLGTRFIDEDSLLPECLLYGGYAFASEDWRYEFRVEQPLWRDYSVSIGGSIYKLLLSDDNKIITDVHNSFFALAATEDYKDYYEAEGGYLFSKVRPNHNFIFETGLRIEKQYWLDAHQELWSLFGGSKKFGHNFNSLNDSQRIVAESEINNKNMRSLVLKGDYKSAPDIGNFDNSFWENGIVMEFTPGSWNDDYDFHRYNIDFAGFLRLNRSFGIGSGINYGNSDGKLPAHRMFYLGGINSLHGYEHKEFAGDEYWKADVEYMFDIPSTDIKLWAFYNLGQIIRSQYEQTDEDIKQSLGIGLSIDKNLRFDFARRLDRSGASPIFHVRFDFSF